MASGDKAERAPNKEERKSCWGSRDKYWECVDTNGLEADRCNELRNLYERACPAQWVKHFDRKYVYTQYKKKIETEGYEPILENQSAATSANPVKPNAPV